MLHIWVQLLQHLISGRSRSLDTLISATVDKSHSIGKISSRKTRFARPRCIILSSSEDSGNDQGSGKGKENLKKSDLSDNSAVDILPPDHTPSRRTVQMELVCSSDSDAILIL